MADRQVVGAELAKKRLVPGGEGEPLGRAARSRRAPPTGRLEDPRALRAKLPAIEPVEGLRRDTASTLAAGSVVASAVAATPGIGGSLPRARRRRLTHRVVRLDRDRRRTRGGGRAPRNSGSGPDVRDHGGSGEPERVGQPRKRRVRVSGPAGDVIAHAIEKRSDGIIATFHAGRAARTSTSPGRRRRRSNARASVPSSTEAQA